MTPKEAMKLAQEADLDLVKIAPRLSHLFARLLITVSTNMNRLQERKEAKKKQKTVEVKEVRLITNIDTNDLIPK